MVQSPDTKRRKAREKMARYRAKQSTEQKEETRRRNALQQKACRVNWTAGRKAKEKKSNTTNQRLIHERLKNMMMEDL